MISEVFNLDCMEGMKQYPDKYFDLAVVDPPYGLGDKIYNGGGAHTKANVKFHHLFSENHKRWDVMPSDEYFKELKRISVNQIIWGGNYFVLGPTRGFIVWDKKQMMPNFSRCEFAWTSFDKPANIAEVPFFGNAKGDITEKIHPTQKPVRLYDWIYKNYLSCRTCNDTGLIWEDVVGDGGSRMQLGCEECPLGEGRNYRVLDTHLGSGSNRIAADRSGIIDFTGYELDKEYFDDQEKRFKNYKLQLRLL